MKIKIETPTIWGYDQDDIKLARKLMECGITPQELKAHIRDWQWVVNKLIEDNKRTLEHAWQQAVRSYTENKND